MALFNRRSKFNAKKAYCAHCHKHDSKREAARCDELHVLWAAGVIGDLVIHPQFYFVINGNQVKHDNGRRVGVKLDFQYKTNDGKIVCEDVKPKSRLAVSRDWPLRKAVFKALFKEFDFYEIH
jgi:hypothetical protein